MVRCRIICLQIYGFMLVLDCAIGKLSIPLSHKDHRETYSDVLYSSVVNKKDSCGLCACIFMDAKSVDLSGFNLYNAYDATTHCFFKVFPKAFPLYILTRELNICFDDTLIR